MSTTTEPGALARLFELHAKTPALLTADDWAAARLEFSQYSIALRTIAQMWDGETVPEPETYDDTESAYNNGHDVACYEAAKVAREAILSAEAAAFDRELLDLVRRRLVEFHDGRVTLTREGYVAITRLFGRS